MSSAELAHARTTESAFLSLKAAALNAAAPPPGPQRRSGDSSATDMRDASPSTHSAHSHDLAGGGGGALAPPPADAGVAVMAHPRAAAPVSHKEDIARIYDYLKEAPAAADAKSGATHTDVGKGGDLAAHTAALRGSADGFSDNSTLPPYLKDLGWTQLLERIGEPSMLPDDPADGGCADGGGAAAGDAPPDGGATAAVELAAATAAAAPPPLSPRRVSGSDGGGATVSGGGGTSGKRAGRSIDRKAKDSKINVRPEVHSLFHSYIDEQHMALALHTADSKAGKLVRASDARILTACCHHFAHLCEEQPGLRERASDAFRLYMMTHKACAPGSRKGIRTSADIIPTLLSIVSPPQGKRLHGVLLEFLILTAIGRSPDLPTLASPALLEQVMQFRGPEGPLEAAAAAAAAVAAGRADSGRTPSPRASPPPQGAGDGDGAAAAVDHAPALGALYDNAWGGGGGDGSGAPGRTMPDALTSEQMAKLSSVLPNTNLSLLSLSAMLPPSSLSELVGLSNFGSGPLSLPGLSPFHAAAAAAAAPMDASAALAPAAAAAAAAPDPAAPTDGLSSLAAAAAAAKLDHAGYKAPPLAPHAPHEPPDIAQIFKSLKEGPADRVAAVDVALHGAYLHPPADAPAPAAGGKRTLDDLAAAAEAAEARPGKRAAPEPPAAAAAAAGDDVEWRASYEQLVAFVEQRAGQRGAALPRTGALGSWCSEQVAAAVDRLAAGGDAAAPAPGLAAARFDALMAVPAFRDEVHKNEAAVFDECLWKLERFVAEASRPPRAAAAGGGEHEAELAVWAAAQRRLALRLAAGQDAVGAMSAARAAQLIAVPGWLEG